MGEIENGIRKMGFDAEMAHNLSEIVRITRETAFEECAKLADDQAKAWINGDARTAIGQAYQDACRATAARIRAVVGTGKQP